MICGHHHPVVTIRDEVGSALKSPAYLLADLDEECLKLGRAGEGERCSRVLFAPAFNELSGYDVMRTIRDPFSPLSRCMKKETAELFLTDGTFLGPVSAVENHEGDRTA
jgi:hypothetical protein